MTIKSSGGPSVRESREEKRFEDRLILVFLVVGTPFISLAVDHASITSLALFQAYALTFATAGILATKRRSSLKQRWFWAAMASALPIHAAAIAGIFFWDKANMDVAFKGFYAVGIVWVVGVLEMLCLVGIIELWNPERN